MNDGINLIGNRSHESVPEASKKLKIVRAIAILLLFGVSSASIVLYILIAFSPLPQVQQQEQEALANLSVAHPDMTKIALLEDRMKGISVVLAKRSKFDAALDTISAKLPPEVSLHQVSMNNSTFSLTVRSYSLEALTTFIDRLETAAENKEYKSLMINSILSDSESNLFSLTISIGL